MSERWAETIRFGYSVLILSRQEPNLAADTMNWITYCNITDMLVDTTSS